MQLFKKTKGVTFLELILVLTIAAILTAIALPKLQKTTDKKRADSAIATLRTISQCLRFYRLENGNAFPANFSELDTDSGGNECMDRNQFEKTYSFPARSTVITAPVTLVATDNQATGRTVCMVPAGTLERSGKIYEYSTPRMTCGVTSNYLRVVDE